MKQDEILMYLNGYLSAISSLNSFTNEHLMIDVNIYPIDSRSSVEEILAGILKTNKYVYTITRIGKLETSLKKILPKYTERFILRIAQTRAYPLFELDESEKDEIINEIKAPIEEIDFSYSICSMINKLLDQDDEFYSVVVDDSKGPFYSLVDDTFIVKGAKRAIHIKFGITD